MAKYVDIRVKVITDNVGDVATSWCEKRYVGEFGDVGNPKYVQFDAEDVVASGEDLDGELE